MFDYLIKDNHLENYFTPEDLTFIKELIHPHSFRKVRIILFVIISASSAVQMLRLKH